MAMIARKSLCGPHSITKISVLHEERSVMAQHSRKYNIGDDDAVRAFVDKCDAAL